MWSILNDEFYSSFEDVQVDDVRAAAKKLWALKHVDTSTITDPKIASLAPWF